MMWLILLLGLGVRLLNLNQSLWLDEAAQAIESVRPLTEQFDIKADFWPPLYHVILHFWMIGGRSEIWMRLLSVAIGVATIYFSFKLTESLTSPKVALLTSFFMALAPFHIWYSQEIRPYALATLLGVISTYLLLKQKHWRYLVSSILLFYSSYLAPMLLLTHGVYLYTFDKKNWWQWIKGVTLLVVAFLPWLPKFREQLMIGQGLTVVLPGWSEAVSAPLIKSFPLVFTKFILGRITFDNKWLYGSLISGLILLFVYLTHKNFQENKTTTSKIILLGGLPILFAFLTSLFLPILAPQRVLFCLPLFYMLWARGIILFGNRRLLQVAAGSVLLLLSGYSILLYNTSPRFQREKWREAIRFVEETRSPTSLAIFVFPEAFAPWQWYSRGVVHPIAVAPRFVVDRELLEKNLSVIVRADKIYYFQYLTELTDPQNHTQSFLESSGFSEISTRDFSGVGFITIYEKALARY